MVSDEKKALNVDLPAEFIAENESVTFEIARRFAKVLKSGDFVAMFGGLGVGKTHFIKGLCEGLGFSGHVFSPTFALINEYRIESVESSSELLIVHCDMYRLGREPDLESIGFFDYLDSDNRIIIVEWSENIVDLLPADCYRVHLSVLGDNVRKIWVKKSLN